MTLITGDAFSLLDLDDWIGQRTAGYRFDLVDIVTGYRRTVTPLRDSTPVLTHDTGRTIKRQIRGLMFGVQDTAVLNTVSGRIEIFMLIGGRQFPLGQYLFNDQTRFRHTSGILSSAGLYDNGFIVDQPSDQSFPIIGVTNPPSKAVSVAIPEILSGVQVTFTVEASPYSTIGSWPAGRNRGYIVEQLAIDGDYFSPWFDHHNVMRFIRAFDPATAIPTFDFDSGNKVMRDRVIETDDLLTAPNRFIVIGNASTTTTTAAVPVVGVYDIPSSAPHSIANRGFVVAQVFDRQIDGSLQAGSIAANLGQRQTVFERVELFTAPDPRHDSYDVIRWQGENWLEIGWSLPLIEGAPMQHFARKAYTS